MLDYLNNISLAIITIIALILIGWKIKDNWNTGLTHMDAFDMLVIFGSLVVGGWTAYALSKRPGGYTSTYKPSSSSTSNIAVAKPSELAE